MQIWSTSRISNEEKENILSKHREVYNGYQTMQAQTNNTQPLYVQDFAKDKVGAMVKNDGTVTPYTNYRINESHVMDTCEQCGGNLTEKECMECGWKMETEIKELSIGDLGVGEKYTYKTPSYDDDIEFEDEIEDKFGGKKMYKFKGKKAHHLMGDKDVESFVSSSVDEAKYETGKLDDIYDEEDLNMSDDFDYVEGGGNDYGTFEKMHHMKSIKNEATATSNAPLSYGKHYNEIDEPYDFKSNGPVGDGGTLRQKSLDEVGYTGGGNAPDFDVDFESPGYDFVSDGPKEDTFTVPADDIDLDEKDVKKPYDFVSDGPETGDVYPVFEEMKSAWDDDDIEELPDMETEKHKRSSLDVPNMDVELDEVDISGAQGSQEKAEKPYAFVSTGPGKAGPYQTHSWGGEQLSSSLEEQSEDEDAYHVDDTEEGELDLDLTKFNPEDKSWEEITAYTGEDEFSHLSENFQKQQEKILEMFIRVRKFN